MENNIIEELLDKELADVTWKIQYYELQLLEARARQVKLLEAKGVQPESSVTSKKSKPKT